MNEDRPIKDASDEELIQILIERHKDDDEQDLRFFLDDALDVLRYEKRGEPL